jgi:predicted nucleic acid-binding Zn ribbon protein
MHCPTCGTALPADQGICPVCGSETPRRRGMGAEEPRGKVIPFRPGASRPRRDRDRERRGRPGRPPRRGQPDARRLMRYIWIALIVVALLWPYLRL